ncbi:MAG: GNAT family N-acetyltransferase [Elusimicrobia bacterium]|nr:GNAT family N-acetyltransferase [Elusimicrobiota bacterium]
MSRLNQTAKAAEALTIEAFNFQNFKELGRLLSLFPNNSDMAQESYLRWQYEDNPAGKAWTQIAKTASGEIVGANAVIPVDVNIQGKKIKGTYSTHSIVKPEFRNRSLLFVDLCENAFNECARRRIPFTFCLPNRISYPIFLKFLNFENLGHATLWLYPFLQLGESIKTKFSLPDVFGRIFNELGRAVDQFHRSRSPKPPIKIERLTQLDARWDDLWKSIAPHFPWSVSKDSSRLTWRFLRCPTRSYSFLAAYKGEELLAWIAGIDQITFGFKAWQIMDGSHRLDQEGREALQALLLKSLDDGRQSGAIVSGCLTTPRHHLAPILKKFGFIACPEPMRPKSFAVALRSYSSEIKISLPLLSDWSLSLGDYDDA